jgi:hypothetical protein
MERYKPMIIWLGSTPYESYELVALLKADVRSLTLAIGELEVEREAKLRAIQLAWHGTRHSA